MHQVLADVADGHDVVGDDLGVDVGNLGLALEEKALDAGTGRASAARTGSKIIRIAEQVGHPADDHAADRQHPPVRENAKVITTTGIPSRSPKKKPKLTIRRSSRGRPRGRSRLASSGLLLDLADHHQLHVEQLVDVGADLVGDVADDLRQLLLRPGRGPPRGPRRQVVPELRVLALHDPLDHVADVAAGGGEDVLGDRLGVELAVEVAGRCRASRSPCRPRSSPSSPPARERSPASRGRRA